MVKCKKFFLGLTLAVFLLFIIAGIYVYIPHINDDIGILKASYANIYKLVGTNEFDFSTAWNNQALRSKMFGIGLNCCIYLVFLVFIAYFVFVPYKQYKKNRDDIAEDSIKEKLYVFCSILAIVFFAISICFMIHKLVDFYSINSAVRNEIMNSARLVNTYKGWDLFNPIMDGLKGETKVIVYVCFNVFWGFIRSLALVFVSYIPYLIYKKKNNKQIKKGDN